MKEYKDPIEFYTEEKPEEAIPVSSGADCSAVIKCSDFSMREHDTPEKECLQMIADVAVGYDGFGTVESLKGLIDEMREYALMGLKGEWPYA